MTDFKFLTTKILFGGKLTWRKYFKFFYSVIRSKKKSFCYSLTLFDSVKNLNYEEILNNQMLHLPERNTITP